MSIDRLKPAFVESSPPDEGPIRVLKRSDKFFKLEMHGKAASVSIKRLKPAFVESSPHYEAPFKVLKRSDKFFKLEMHRKAAL